MKKYMLLLAGLLCLVVSGEVEAKAVKLGRSVSVASGNKVLPKVCKKGDPDCNCLNKLAHCSKCVSNTQCIACKDGYYLVNGKCSKCPDGSNKCGIGPQPFLCKKGMRRDGDKCVANCTGVRCKTGYVPTSNDTGCCCTLDECPTGQRISNGKCVSICTGVQCKPGFTAKVNGNKCCCEASLTPAISCLKGYRNVNGKCVANCTGVQCRFGAIATPTDTGCCCELQKIEPVLKSCASGYRMVNGECVANCTGVRCIRGAKAVSNANGCCCESLKIKEPVTPVIKEPVTPVIKEPVTPVIQEPVVKPAVEPAKLNCSTICGGPSYSSLAECNAAIGSGRNRGYMCEHIATCYCPKNAYTNESLDINSLLR